LGFDAWSLGFYKMHFPSFAHWRQFVKILSLKEKTIFFGGVAAAIAAAGYLVMAFYQNNTAQIPAEGGVYTEGVIGRARFLNPIYAASYGADQDIVELLFTGLLEYDSKGNIVPGLANYEISEDGKTYEFFLRENAKWSDGAPITSDDAIYTAKIIQDPVSKSSLRPQWIGVETEKISDTSFRFKLQQPYSSFAENCTLKIIPRHIWENIDANNFSLSPLNLNPVGTGPYRIKKVNTGAGGAVDSVELEKNPHYYGSPPWLRQINFMFFSDNGEMTAAFRQGKIQGYVMQENNGGIPAGAAVYNYFIPRYFALFFNPQNNSALADVRVRTALSRAIDRKAIVENIPGERATAINGPLFDKIHGIMPPENILEYNPAEAAGLLDEAGYTLGEDDWRVMTASKKPAFQFTKTLVKGSKETAEIQELQKCLARAVMPELEATGNFGDQTLQAVNLFQEKYRTDILDPQGLKNPTGDVKAATREKLNEICFPAQNNRQELKIEIAVADKEPLLSVANAIKNQWQDIGVAAEIKEVPAADIERDAAKPRDYEALLFGQLPGMIPDLYPFWHSSQKIDPGLNFSIYENKDADKLMEDIRAESDAAIRAEKLEALQNLIIKDAPAIFLYNPHYIHIVSKSVKGITAGVIADPARRFLNIANWHILTKRIFDFGKKSADPVD